MQKLIIYSVLLLLIQQNSYCQTYKSGVSFGGLGPTQCFDMVTDKNHNLYTVGIFYGSADFDPSDSTYMLYSAGVHDAFIQKLDSSGNFLWAHKIGAASTDDAYSICVDENNNVYVTGSFFGGMDINPDPDSINWISSMGYSDIYIVKFNSNGKLIWDKTVNGIYFEYARGIEIDKYSNVIIAGNFGGSVDFYPGPGIDIRTSLGASDFFALKLDTLGNYISCNTFGGPGQDVVEGMDISKDNGSIHLTGEFDAPIDFDTGIGDFILYPGGVTGYEMFIFKIDNSLNFNWAVCTDNKAHVDVKEISVTTFNESIIVGQFSDSIDFDPSLNEFWIPNDYHGEAFVLKLDSNGLFNWVRTFQGMGDAYSDISGIDVDELGTVYTSGVFQDTVDFDLGNDTVLIASKGGTDSFINCLSSEGNTIWAHAFGNLGYYAQVGQALCCDSGGIIYFGHLTEGACDFNPFSGIDFSDYSAFIQKFQDINPVTIANAGNDIWTCDTAVSLIGNVPMVGSGNWNLVAGPNSPIIVSPDSSNTWITGLTEGDYIFKWVISNPPLSPSIDYLHIHVLSLPSNIASGNSVVCEGDSIQLTAPFIPFASYTWIGPDSFYSNLQNPLVTPFATNSIEGTYFLICNLLTCNDTSSYNLIVHNSPIVNLIFDPLDSICKNASPLSLEGGTPIGGIYDGPGTGLGAFNPSVIDTSSFVLINYLFTDSSGCSNSAVDTIFVLIPPNVSIDLSHLDSICINSMPVILNTGLPIGGTYSGTGVSGTTFDPNITGSGSFNITYSFIDTLGCLNSNSDIITVHALPNVHLNLSCPDTICSDNISFALNGGSPIGGNYYGAGVVSNIFDPNISGQGNFEIIYIYTDSYGCQNSDTNEIFVDFCLELTELQNDNIYIDVFPNPFENNISIISSHFVQAIQLYNIDGKMCFMKTINSTAFTCALDQLESGLYHLKLYTDQGMESLKIVKLF